jgi:signal transduction histidine kinase
VARARPRRGALGLRGRIVGAVVVTTVATLGVAALTLLGPLEQSLRHAALNTLKRDLQTHPTRPFENLGLDPPFSRKPRRSSPTIADSLKDAQDALASRVGGNVYVLGFPEYGTWTGRLQVPLSPADSQARYDSFSDVAAAFRTTRPQYGFTTIDGTDYAAVALPFRSGGFRYVLAVRRRIDEIPGAVHAVRNAFLTSALAGLALTLILAIPLAATLVRRLRRLRQVALRVAQGDLAVDVPVDPSRDEVGDLTRTFATMQRRLLHQEQARRAFVATASHELRTPLASLDGMLELVDDDLRSGDPDLDDARELLERARAQSRRLGRLAADLLDLSRIDADVMLRSEPVELGELSRAVMAEFELASSERGINAELDDSAGQVWALGDPGSVARIVRILLDNAVRVSPDGTEITVRLANGDGASLSVCDHGPGVPPEEREVIFERFQRGRDTSGQAGFGLGLAIGRELAERMGGTLVLEDSEEPGARFTLSLPISRAPEPFLAV